MTVRVAVAGASGYGGGELLRLLQRHPGVTLGALGAGSHAGEPVASVHPHLVSLGDRSFDPTDPALLADADVVFLALPHGASAEIAAQLPDDARILDLGADFRLRDPAAWKRYYTDTHAGTWPYGLPELPGGRAALAGRSRIAVPGCYATTVNLALAPLLAAGLVEPADIVVVAGSGTSGAGRSAKVNLLGSEVMGDLSAYKVAGHQHTAEIGQALGDAAGVPVALSFTPMLVPMPRGILATCTARVAPGVTAAAVRGALADAYAGEAFVHVLPEGRWPRTGSTLGSNSCHLQATVDADAGRAVVVSALDNLVKGAAGQAVQCMNIMLDLPEGTGLSADGVAP